MFLEKLKGEGQALPPLASWQNILKAWGGGFIAISVLVLLSKYSGNALILGSFGATCVLLFGFPDVPFSQPRNIILGHFIASLTGLIVMSLLGYHWYSAAIATATAIALMMATKTVHPPAGSNPVIIFLSKPAWSFLLFPTLSGAIILVIIGLIYLNIIRKENYPKYW